MEALEKKDLFKSNNKFFLINYMLALKISKVSSFFINLINFLLSIICIIFYILMTYNIKNKLADKLCGTFFDISG